MSHNLGLGLVCLLYGWKEHYSGKILSSELVGDLAVSGSNAKDKHVTAYMVFGAKETK